MSGGERSAAAEDAVRAQGYRVAAIEAPGTLDGGDVLKHGGILWVGIGGRTNAEGIAQLQAHLRPFGVNVMTVPVTKALHLKSAITALPDGTIIGYEPVVVDDPRVWGQRFLAVPEEPGRCRTPRGRRAPDVLRRTPHGESLRTARLSRDSVDISEFEKLEGV